MKKCLALLLFVSAVLPGAAIAQEFEFRYNDGPRYRDREYRPYRDDRPRYCTPRQALEIARDQGFPGAKIGRTTNKWIEIRGSGNRTIVFGLSPRCPILGYND